MDSAGPLSGLRVIEWAGWNAVLAGRLLADGGAEVVRIVTAEGDPLDAEAPFFGDSRISIQATWYNAGKRVVRLDVNEASAREQALSLIGSADILIEDWPAGQPPIDMAGLEVANPSLVRVSVTPMGLDGPNAHFVTNDLVANALSGSASVTGDRDTPPLTGYGNQSYHTVGLYAALCALAALRGARSAGKGVRVDLSAHEALATATEQVLMQWFFPEGAWPSPIAVRQASLHWSGAYEVYPGRSGGEIMVTAALRFADVLLPWLLEDGAAQGLADPAKYPDLVAMVRDLPYVMKVLREWVGANDAEELFFEAQRRHQPFGAVYDIAHAVGSPQVEARAYLQPREIPGFGKVPFPGRFFRTNADGGHPTPPARVQGGEIGWRPRSRSGSASQSRVEATAPLAGVRVMDFTHVLAGPFGTRILGDLGADVIKISTASRATGANVVTHPYYVCWNRNKRNVSLDLATGAGLGVARRLAGKCDLIVENFSAGVLKRWGLDRSSMAGANPGLSVIAMGGMGQGGPWSNFVTYAPTIHALVGLTHLTSFPGRDGIGYGFSLTDHLSGIASALATLEALEHRDRTGQGLEIDLAQFELGLGLMGPSILDYLANGVNAQPVGNRHPFGGWAPHGIYRGAGDDRWVAIAVRGDVQWKSLCELMGRPELASDQHFSSHARRIENQDALDAVIEDWTRTRDRYEIMALCQSHRIAAGAVQDARDLTGADRQLRARGFFGTAGTGQQGGYPVDCFPALFDGRRPSTYRGVRQLGADTFDVLRDVLELSDEEIAELAAAGALS